MPQAGDHQGPQQRGLRDEIRGEERVEPAVERDTDGQGPAPLEPGRGTAEDRPWRSTITGRVDVTHLMHRGQRRAVRTYLPPGYEQSAAEHPVLYMFDGQNLFDRSTTAFGMEWGIDETIESLVSTGEGPAAVVVGVDSPPGPMERYCEYSAWDWELDGRAIVADGGATADFLADQVIPYTRDTYRVARERDRVGLAGSSMGGYMTLFAGARDASLYGRLLAFSPVMLDRPMAGDSLRAFLTDTGFDPGTWIYLDMGDAEELSYIDGPRQLVEDLARTTEAITASARPPEKVVSRVIAGAAHDELAWGARFGAVLTWAFAGGPQPR